MRHGEIAAACARKISTISKANPNRPPAAVRRLNGIVAYRVLMIELVGYALGRGPEIHGRSNDFGVAAAWTRDFPQCIRVHAYWAGSVPRNQSRSHR